MQKVLYERNRDPSLKVLAQHGLARAGVYAMTTAMDEKVAGV